MDTIRCRFPDEVVGVRGIDADGLNRFGAAKLGFVCVAGENDISIGGHQPEAEFASFDFVTFEYCRHCVSPDIHIQRFA